MSEIEISPETIEEVPIKSETKYTNKRYLSCTYFLVTLFIALIVIPYEGLWLTYKPHAVIALTLVPPLLVYIWRKMKRKTFGNNIIFYNNFINNTNQVYVNDFLKDLVNKWDNGYPSGGNYWSDHVCTGNPSNGSQPYVIDSNNIDHYPFQDPCTGEGIDTDVDGIPDVTDADDDGDGMPDVWETANGLNPVDAADASLDPDGDGLTNLQEYQRDADPNDYFSPFPVWIAGVVVAAVVGVAIVVYFVKVRKP